jgi:16S rRNA (guanine(1405)-N(7))-methyltransferase
MIDEVAARVSASPRYRHVDPHLVARLAAEEAPRARNADDAVKRVKRRLHQAVGAFRGGRGGAVTESLAALRAAWAGDLEDPAVVAACRELLSSHASTAERVPHLEAFYTGIWEAAGAMPASVLDLGCGLAPLGLPWMRLPPTTHYLAVDVDRRALETVDAFLDLVGQPHAVEARDLAAGPPPDLAADVALLLKLVPTLDRQDLGAAARLLTGLRMRHAAISFPRRSLGGRSRGMERTYRARLAKLAAETGFEVVAEPSVANELVFVLEPRGG